MRRHQPRIRINSTARREIARLESVYAQPVLPVAVIKGGR